MTLPATICAISRYPPTKILAGLPDDLSAFSPKLRFHLQKDHKRPRHAFAPRNHCQAQLMVEYELVPTN